MTTIWMVAPGDGWMDHSWGLRARLCQDKYDGKNQGRGGAWRRLRSRCSGLQAWAALEVWPPGSSQVFVSSSLILGSPGVALLVFHSTLLNHGCFKMCFRNMFHLN